MLSHLSTMPPPVPLLPPSTTLRRVGDCCFVLLPKKLAPQPTAILTNALSFLSLGLSAPRVPAQAVSQPRASSQPPPATKSVQFDLDSDSSSVSPFASPGSEKTRIRHRQSGGLENHSYSTNNSEIPLSATNDSPRSRRRRHHRRRASQTDISRSPSPAHSDSTIDLPERFDQYGRRIPERGEDPLADKIEDLFSGKGAAGMLLEKLTGAFGGGSDGDGDGGKRRRRRR